MPRPPSRAEIGWQDGSRLRRVAPMGMLRRRPLGEAGAGAVAGWDQPWPSGMAMSATWVDGRNEPMRLARPVSRLTLWKL